MLNGKVTILPLRSQTTPPGSGRVGLADLKRAALERRARQEASAFHAHVSALPSTSQETVNDHLFHISLRSRCTAILAGFRTLDPYPVRTGTIGAIDHLGNYALGTKPTGMGEHRRPISR
jgi:hypothetical protein